MNYARIKLPERLSDISKKELKGMIEDNIYNPDKRNIAIKYYIEEKCMLDIAIEYNIDRKTVSCILQRVLEELIRVVQ